MSSANSSLRPAWSRGNQSGRGFQPPPAVASERSRSQSIGSEHSQTTPSFNKFAALDDDEDILDKAIAEDQPKGNSRSEALRSGGRSTSTGSKVPGRSLADLVARVPERPRSGSRGSEGTAEPPPVVVPKVVVEAKVIRYTRERLLSMRPAPFSAPPPHMKAVEGTVILSMEPQDPVCWDTFDAEAIWATVPRERRPAVKPAPGMRGTSGGIEGAGEMSGGDRRISRRGDSGGGGGGRWQRGVALPPPDQTKKGRENSDNPDDLWDDPADNTGAAIDFSAFGANLDGPSGDTGGDAFDFDKMAEASRKLEEEMRGGPPRSRASSDANSVDVDNTELKIDPKRPLASIGTTIRSGSGDGINVFEDFDDPASGEEAAPIKSLGEDPSASSRLMKMIGVVKDEPAAGAPAASAWGAQEPASSQQANKDFGISLNPWGGPAIPSQGERTQPQQQQGLDLQARLREAAEAEQQKARELELRRRQEQEETQRRAAAQQQGGQAQPATQQAGVQSQVELVLVERISTILENTWGRADLMAILTTLHAEDSRVIPLLNNVDALRALLLRNPRRIALRQDPASRAEMAVLLITNSQWSQTQEQEARVQQQEMQRREQQRMQEEQRKAVAERAQSEMRNFVVIPDAPWYYSDPQKNIQGPFRGEEMRQWLEAGYFKGDLPISQQTTGPFHQLSGLFPDLSVAFMAKPDNAEQDARMKAERDDLERQEAENSQAEARARDQADRERQAMEAADRERKAMEVAERERRSKEKAGAAKKAESENNGNESSTQLKLMLGLSSQDAAAQADAPVPSKASEKRTKSGKQRSSKEQQSAVEPAAKNAPPAWGGASQPSTKKSMSEIQKEEARAAAVNATNQKGSRSSSSGWANVAAARGGSTAWSGAAATQTPAAVVTKAPAAAPTGIQSRSKAKVAAAVMPATAATQQRANSSVAEEFGAKMSPALEKWCKDEMKKLNGTDDITLASFCMSLKDPEEIRQYFTAYLGSTPPVNKFATEFISKKGGGKSQQEEWETTATAKKGRKKKAGR